MRIGTVSLVLEYVVDLDDADMVEEARECLIEDFYAAAKYDEVADNVKIQAAPDRKEEDIPPFLQESKHQRESESEENQD